MKGATAMLMGIILLAACQAQRTEHPTTGDWQPGQPGGEGDACFSFETVNNVGVLTIAKRYSGHLSKHPGFTSRPYRLDIKTSQRPCGKFKEIVWTNDIIIHVSEKLGDCQLREVFKHERKHVMIYLDAFEEIPPWVDGYMQGEGKNASDKKLYKDIYATILGLQKRITEKSKKHDWRDYKNPAITHYLVKACGSIWGE